MFSDGLIICDLFSTAEIHGAAPRKSIFLDYMPHFLIFSISLQPNIKNTFFCAQFFDKAKKAVRMTFSPETAAEGQSVDNGIRPVSAPLAMQALISRFSVKIYADISGYPASYFDQIAFLSFYIISDVFLAGVIFRPLHKPLILLESAAFLHHVPACVKVFLSCRLQSHFSAGSGKISGRKDLVIGYLSAALKDHCPLPGEAVFFEYVLHALVGEIRVNPDIILSS